MKGKGTSMKKGIAAVIIAVLCIVTFHIGKSVGASSSEPGSVGDPLITESYLEKRLSEAVGGSSSSNSTEANYQEVTIKSGKTLTLEKGSEVVLYSGNADISNGRFVNLSAGTVFKSGNSAVKYNTLLAVSSNSSLKATSDITVFVRGSYSK